MENSVLWSSDAGGCLGDESWLAYVVMFSLVAIFQEYEIRISFLFANLRFLIFLGCSL